MSNVTLQPEFVTAQRLLESVVRSKPADAILLSAGLDTSIIAALAVSCGQSPLAVTVCWDDSSLDLNYATELAKVLSLKHLIVRCDAGVYTTAVPAVIGILRSFDPMEIRNSVVQYLGLKAVKDSGKSSCFVGDAADELFAGYSFMTKMEPAELSKFIQRMSKFMRFSANTLGQHLNVEVVSPYLNSEIVDFALDLPCELRTGIHMGELHGKWILRQAFQDILSDRFIWRTKTPAEHGSGITPGLDNFMQQSESFSFVSTNASHEAVKLRSLEHEYYYSIFRTIFPRPGEIDSHNENRCPECCGPLVNDRSKYCRSCGAYPV